MASTKINTLRKVVLVAVIFTIFLITKCEAQQKLCGNRLSETLKLVCRNKYNMVGKKSIAMADYYDDDQYNFEGFDTMPFLNKLYPGVISPNVRRTKQGIVNECCKKSCSLAELSAYCYQGN